MRITPGKQKGMKAVSDSRGVIAAAAMDQRGSLKSAIAKERGVDKNAVTAADARGIQDRRHARSHASRQRHPARSRIRSCPPRSARSKNAGLLLAYENSGYDNTRPGRLPDLLDIWSVRRLVGCRSRLHQDSSLLHAFRFARDQRNQARLGRAHRRGVHRTATCHFSWSSSATKRAATKRESSSRARSPKSSPRAWKNSRSRNTPSTS